MRWRRASWIFTVGWLGIAPTGVARDPERLRDKTCAVQVEELKAVAAGDAPARVAYARTLRRKVLENPGASHRAHARRALVKLWYLQLAPSPTAKCADDAVPLTAEEAAAVAPDYALADAGVKGAAELRKVLTDANTTPLRRAVVAHALSLTGVIPDQAMTDELLTVVARETDPVARFEEALALAAYAQRSKTAFTPFKALLLKEKDSAFVEALARSLPGEDLRYRIFHRIGTKTARARQVRGWIRQ